MKHRYFAVGNTHFDPVWLWTWDEAMASIRATFRSALDRMKEYPDFVYSFATPPVFEWIRKTDPRLFEEIRARVAEGRWELAEGWWNQPDCFSASGESYVRQGLYGQRYLLSTFGKTASCVFNTDSFGHPATFPQILRKSGIRYYCLCRPEEKHYHLEHPLFRWVGEDGSTVTAFRIGSAAGDGWQKNVSAAMDSVVYPDENILIVYGVTDHGGAPTKEAIETIRSRDDAVLSSLAGFFEAQGEVVNTVKGEFVTGDFGVYCNGNEIKKRNRAAEYALLDAERALVLAGGDSRDLTSSWQDVLFNQFHDILGGSSIREAYTDARNLHGRALQNANEALHFSLQKITSRIRMPGKNPDNAWNLVLWNLNAAPYDGYVEAEVQWAHEFDWYDGEIALEDEAGNRVETQIIGERSVIPRFRSRFVFPAALPSVGYAAWKVVRTDRPIEPPAPHDPATIQTDNYLFRIDRADGSISSVTDLRTGEEVLRRAFRPTCYEDLGDTWCFNIDGYGKTLGKFAVRSIGTVESGRWIERVKVTLAYADSLLDLYYTFYRKEDYFDLSYRVNWNEAHTVFKFDFDCGGGTIRCATPYGEVTRAENRRDCPVGEWIRTDRNLIVSDGIFAYRLDRGVLGLTVLRSCVYGDFRLGDLPARDLPVMEQGITEGRIRLFLDPARCCPQIEANRFNNPPLVIDESNHGGDLPSRESFCSLAAESAILSVIKTAEDGDGIVFRVVEYAGRKQTAALTFEGKTYDIPLGAHEIKTVKLSGGALSEVDLLEFSEEQPS